MAAEPVISRSFVKVLVLSSKWTKARHYPTHDIAEPQAPKVLDQQSDPAPRMVRLIIEPVRFDVKY